MTSMNIHHPRFRETQKANIQSGTVFAPRKPTIQTRNIAIRPSTSHQKNKSQDLDFVSILMNLSAFAKTRQSNIPSNSQQQSSTSRSNRNHPGFKYTRMKLPFSSNRFPRNTAGYSQSLYQKSLKRTKSIRSRRDFQDSVREISSKKYLTAKRSILSGQPEHNPKHPIQHQHPESATIIIQLKRMFNNRVGYNFVHNQVTLPEDTKRDQQIYSTTHTNTQADRPVSYTHSLQRTRSAKRDSSSKGRVNKSLTAENQLIPWQKETERLQTEHQFGFTEIFTPLPTQ